MSLVEGTGTSNVISLRQRAMDAVTFVPMSGRENSPAATPARTSGGLGAGGRIYRFISAIARWSGADET